MIVWINGCFGVGKTTVSKALQTHLPDAFFFDPEIIGFAIRDLTPTTLRANDFQDIALWRHAITEMLMQASVHDYIVPMTLLNSDYHAEIIGTLRQTGVAINHFVLTADKATILSRLKQRGDGGNEWIRARLDAYWENSYRFPENEQIDTTQVSVEKKKM